MSGNHNVIFSRYRQLNYFYFRNVCGFSTTCFRFPVSVFPSYGAEDTSIENKPKMFYSAVGRPVSWLSNYCPEFGVSGKDIKFLHEPTEFYEKLKELSAKSTKRITLASLYIGTGPLERELVSAIQTGLSNSNNQLKVKILLDYTRGSRGKENSRILLLPLLKKFSCQVQVSLYHTPELRGLIKWILPERWNETIGLSHLKVYLFDDTLILSGANLSDQYFTNRQDRYVIFHNCSELADFFDNLVSTVSKFSFQLEPDNSVSLHPTWSVHPYDGNYKEFIKKANQALQGFIVPSSAKQNKQSILEEKCQSRKCIDTIVYPLLQMHTFAIRQDENVVQWFLLNAEPSSVIKLASGYFNLTDHYMDIILKSSKATYNLLVASPKVNGFYGASGVAGAIPAAYTYIAKLFFRRILDRSEQERIFLHEYERPSWTFHVKGLWYYKPMEKLPSVTLIGSPNFGYRSVYKDLEAQVAIVTNNSELKQQLHQEQKRLYNLTTLVDNDIFERPDRQVPFWVKLVTFFIKSYF